MTELTIGAMIASAPMSRKRPALALSPCATAIHGLDAVRYLLGSDYTRLDFTYQPLPQFGDHVVNIYVHGWMTSNTRVRLEFCPVAGVYVERATVHADGSTFYLDLPCGMPLIRPAASFILSAGSPRRRSAGST